MEKKMIKYIFLLFLATLTVACCDGFCKGEKLCNQINSNKVSALNNYDICRIRRRNDYYEIYKPNGEFEMYLSIKKDRFYYKNYYSKKDSAMINALVDVIRVINKQLTIIIFFKMVIWLLMVLQSMSLSILTA